jgi:hypothetical protein
MTDYGYIRWELRKAADDHVELARVKVTSDTGESRWVMIPMDKL